MTAGQEIVSQRYLDGLPDDRRAELHRVNADGVLALREILDSGQGLAFLGAGVSAPLYPLWAEVISRLIGEAASRLSDDEARTCRDLATGRPDAVVDIVHRAMGDGDYHAALRKLFAPRKDPVTQRTWTPVHELVVRCNLAGVITTNYDPGIHAHLDRIENADRGWRAKAEQLHAELVPPGLDPDPLATVEAMVAEQRRASGEQ